MKKIILYIDTLYRGGAQRVMLNLASYFSSSYDVVLINDFIPDDTKDSYQVSDQVKRLYLRENLDGNPIKKNIDRILTLRKIVKEEKPDVVLSFLGSPNKRMLIATMGLNCKKVVSVRNDPEREYGKGKLSRFIAKRLFAKADGVVFQTQDAANYFQDSVRKKSRIIYNPVSNIFYKIERVKEPHHVITVGRFEPQKNHKLLLTAWNQIQNLYPDEKLIIYGDGPLRAEYEAYIREFQIQDRVELPGVVTDVPARLASAKAFVLSSDFEGMPNALMEAMAVGVPSISTDCPCGGPKMLMRDQKDGFLVPCNELAPLANAICMLLNDKRREGYGVSAKKRAEIFKEERIYKQWEEFVFAGLEEDKE